MNLTTKLLVFLVILTLSINYYMYFDVDDKKMASKITMITQRIAKEEAFKIIQDDISYENFDQNLTENIFDTNIQSTSALAQLQKIIENAADVSTIKLNRIVWEDPYKLHNIAIEVLPIQINIDASPKQLYNFVTVLQSQQKIIKVDTMLFSINPRDNTLKITMQLQAFKKANNV